MKIISEYITEKLKIDKDSTIKLNPYVEGMIYIIDEKVNDEIEKLLTDWIGDYKNKTLYCYLSKFDYKERFPGVGRYKNISINPVDDKQMEHAKEISFGELKYIDKTEKESIQSILMVQYDLAVYFKDRKYPIVFEKTKL